MSSLGLHAPSLIFLLIFLIGLSVFFSLAETSMLSVNRYRIRHLARHRNRSAKNVQQLLERPDRLLGVILLGNTCASIFASAVATLLAVHYMGPHGVIIETILLTLVILIFGEIAPKTLAALFPQKIAFLIVWPLMVLLRVFYPIVWAINTFTNNFLYLLGVRITKGSIEHLSHEELRTVLHEAGSRIQIDYRTMLIKILDLEKVTIDDIMIPRSEMVGIDLSSDWNTILAELTNNQYNRLPVYQESMDHVVGMIHIRKALNLLAEDKLNKDTLLEAIEEAYYIPEGTPLNVQLLNFRDEKNRSGFVVNEYGDILGLVTLEDILEEIVGEFTTDIAAMTSKALRPQEDGSFVVDGSITLRELNRTLHINITSKIAKTLSGAIIEYLEIIPRTNMSLRLDGYPMEIMQVKDNTVKAVKLLSIKPKLH